MFGHTSVAGLTAAAINRESQTILARHSLSINSQWSSFIAAAVPTADASSPSSPSSSSSSSTRFCIDINQTIASFKELSSVFSTHFQSNSHSENNGSEASSKIEKDFMFYTLIFKVFVMIMTFISYENRLDIGSSNNCRGEEEEGDDFRGSPHRFDVYLLKMADILDRHNRHAGADGNSAQTAAMEEDDRGSSHSNYNSNSNSNSNSSSGNNNSSSSSNSNSLLSSSDTKVIDELVSVFCESIKLVENPNINLKHMQTIHFYIMTVLIKSINGFIASNFNLLKKLFVTLVEPQLFIGLMKAVSLYASSNGNSSNNNSNSSNSSGGSGNSSESSYRHSKKNADQLMARENESMLMYIILNVFLHEKHVTEYVGINMTDIVNICPSLRLAAAQNATTSASGGKDHKGKDKVTGLSSKTATQFSSYYSMDIFDICNKMLPQLDSTTIWQVSEGLMITVQLFSLQSFMLSHSSSSVSSSLMMMMDSGDDRAHPGQASNHANANLTSSKLSPTMIYDHINNSQNLLSTQLSVSDRKKYNNRILKFTVGICQSLKLFAETEIIPSFATNESSQWLLLNNLQLLNSLLCTISKTITLSIPIANEFIQVFYDIRNFFVSVSELITGGTIIASYHNDNHRSPLLMCSNELMIGFIALSKIDYIVIIHFENPRGDAPAATTVSSSSSSGVVKKTKTKTNAKTSNVVDSDESKPISAVDSDVTPIAAPMIAAAADAAVKGQGQGMVLRFILLIIKSMKYKLRECSNEKDLIRNLSDEEVFKFENRLFLAVVNVHADLRILSDLFAALSTIVNSDHIKATFQILSSLSPSPSAKKSKSKKGDDSHENSSNSNDICLNALLNLNYESLMHSFKTYFPSKMNISYYHMLISSTTPSSAATASLSKNTLLDLITTSHSYIIDMSNSIFQNDDGSTALFGRAAGSSSSSLNQTSAADGSDGPGLLLSSSSTSSSSSTATMIIEGSELSSSNSGSSIDALVSSLTRYLSSLSDKFQNNTVASLEFGSFEYLYVENSCHATVSVTNLLTKIASVLVGVEASNGSSIAGSSAIGASLIECHEAILSLFDRFSSTILGCSVFDLQIVNLSVAFSFNLMKYLFNYRAFSKLLLHQEFVDIGPDVGKMLDFVITMASRGDSYNSSNSNSNSSNGSGNNFIHVDNLHILISRFDICNSIYSLRDGQITELLDSLVGVFIDKTIDVLVLNSHNFIEKDRFDSFLELVGDLYSRHNLRFLNKMIILKIKSLSDIVESSSSDRTSSINLKKLPSSSSFSSAEKQPLKTKSKHAIVSSSSSSNMDSNNLQRLSSLFRFWECCNFYDISDSIDAGMVIFTRAVAILSTAGMGTCISTSGDPLISAVTTDSSCFWSLGTYLLSTMMSSFRYKNTSSTMLEECNDGSSSSSSLPDSNNFIFSNIFDRLLGGDVERVGDFIESLLELHGRYSQSCNSAYQGSLFLDIVKLSIEIYISDHKVLFNSISQASKSSAAGGRSGTATIMDSCHILLNSIFTRLINKSAALAKSGWSFSRNMAIYDVITFISQFVSRTATGSCEAYFGNGDKFNIDNDQGISIITSEHYSNLLHLPMSLRMEILQLSKSSSSTSNASDGFVGGGGCDNDVVSKSLSFLGRFAEALKISRTEVTFDKLNQEAMHVNGFTSSSDEQRFGSILGVVELIHSIGLLANSQSSCQLQRPAILFILDLFFKCLMAYLPLGLFSSRTSTEEPSSESGARSYLSFIQGRFERCFDVVMDCCSAAAAGGIGIGIGTGGGAMDLSILEKCVEYFTFIFGKFDLFNSASSSSFSSSSSPFPSNSSFTSKLREDGYSKYSLLLQLSKSIVFSCFSRASTSNLGLQLSRSVIQCLMVNVNIDNTKIALLSLTFCEEIILFLNKRYISVLGVSGSDNAQSASNKRKRDNNTTSTEVVGSASAITTSATAVDQNSGDYSNLFKILSLLLNELSILSQHLNGIVDSIKTNNTTSNSSYSKIGRLVSGGGAFQRDVRDYSDICCNIIRCDKVISDILEKISMAILHKSYQNIVYSTVAVFLSILKSLFYRCEFYHTSMSRSGDQISSSSSSSSSSNSNGVSASSYSSTSSFILSPNQHRFLSDYYQEIFGVSLPRVVLNIAKSPLNPSLSLSCHLLIACIESFAMKQHLITEGLKFAQFGLIDSFFSVGGSAGRTSKRNTKHFVIKHLNAVGQIYFKDILINYSSEYKFVGKS